MRHQDQFPFDTVKPHLFAATKCYSYFKSSISASVTQVALCATGLFCDLTFSDECAYGTPLPGMVCDKWGLDNWRRCYQNIESLYPEKADGVTAVSVE